MSHTAKISVGTEGLATIEEAAAFLSCTPAAVRKWISQGRLPRVKLGRLVRVPRSDLARLATHGLPRSQP